MSDTAIANIYNFLKLSDSVATAGQPTESQFSAIRAAGYQVIINLALPESPNALPHEQKIVEECGMQYVHIPVIWENPTLADFDRFLEAMKANAGKKIFVHCAANMRVSAFMYLYRSIVEGMSAEEAERDLHKIWLPNETWQQFIKQAREHPGFVGAKHSSENL